MVELVNIFILREIVIEPQHIAVKAGNENFLIPHAIHADALEQGLHLFGGGREFQCFAYQLAFVILAKVGDVRLK